MAIDGSTMKLFISYSSKDRDVVTTLADDLDLLEHSVWFDRELNRSGGHKWWKLICEQIRACEGFIYALSEHVLHSVPCQREYMYARALGKPVLPLILADLDFRYLPRDLQESQLLNFRTRTMEQRRALRDSLHNLPACPSLPPNALELEPPAPLDPVGVLIDRIHNLTNDPDAQKLLILDIDDLEENQQYAAQVPELLGLLVARDDVLTVRNLKRAQELLNKAPVPSSPPVPKIDVAPQPTAPKRPTARDMLPAPFDWIRIPAGKVTLKTEKGWAKNYIPKGQTQTFDVPAFSIAKYPLTNGQFAKFIEAGGYAERRWWTDAGWEAREQGIEWNQIGKEWQKKVTGIAWTQPRYWTDGKWNQAQYPVVGVSWYEAIAYCQWLSEYTGEAIMLPTEQQWQRAAQGYDGRDYPWGKEWDANRCNNSVGRDRETNQTSTVIQYEDKGNSPFGVVDMAGNVWEWCLTAYESGSNALIGTSARVLRGGSWYTEDSDAFRCGDRGRYDPGGRDESWGFRPALS